MFLLSFGPPKSFADFYNEVGFPSSRVASCSDLPGFSGRGEAAAPTTRGPKDHINTRHDLWYPPSIGPWNQNVRSLRLCGLLGSYKHPAKRKQHSTEKRSRVDNAKFLRLPANVGLCMPTRIEVTNLAAKPQTAFGSPYQTPNQSNRSPTGSHACDPKPLSAPLRETPVLKEVAHSDAGDGHE